MTPKGQTALEYLLIVVVMMAIVLALFLLLRPMGQIVINQTGQEVNPLLCASTRCTDTQNCTALGVCGPASTCVEGKCYV